MNLSENIDLALRLIPIELFNTFYMVFVSAFFALVIGFPLGVILFLSDRGGLKENRTIYQRLVPL